MKSSNGCKIKVLAVFNKCTETTIPFENFLRVNSDLFEKHVVSFYQSNDQILNYRLNRPSSKKVNFYGLKFKKLNFFIAIYRFFSIIFKIKPDVIHVHHNISGIVASLIALLFRKTKIITTVHNDFNFYNRRQKTIFFLTYILSDLIVCNSHNTRETVIKLRKYFPSTPIVVIYNGIDIQKIANAQQEMFSIKDSGFYTIGTVGRLIPQKDHKTLLEAFSMFHRQFKNSQLIIIGEGNLREELKQLTEKLGIQKNVLFCGLITRYETYQRLCSFDLFVMSSRWEGFCNAMVEAMAAGVPVLASNVSPLPEVLGHKNGWLFDAGDINNLYEKISYCYNNITDVKRLADKASEYAKERYSLETSTKRYEDIYTHVAKPNSIGNA